MSDSVCGGSFSSISLHRFSISSFHYLYKSNAFKFSSIYSTLEKPNITVEISVLAKHHANASYPYVKPSSFARVANDYSYYVNFPFFSSSPKYPSHASLNLFPWISYLLPSGATPSLYFPDNIPPYSDDHTVEPYPYSAKIFLYSCSTLGLLIILYIGCSLTGLCKFSFSQSSIALEIKSAGHIDVPQ